MSAKFEITIELPMLDDAVGLEEAIMDRLVMAMTERISKTLDDDVHKRVSREIQERVAGIVTAAVENPVVQTNRYGEETGKRITLREMIVKAADEYLKQKVNSRGETGYCSDRQVDRLEWIACKAASDILGVQVADIGAQIKKELAGQMEEKIRAAVMQIIGIKQ
jgi:hypothetical protein